MEKGEHKGDAARSPPASRSTRSQSVADSGQGHITHNGHPNNHNNNTPYNGLFNHTDVVKPSPRKIKEKEKDKEKERERDRERSISITNGTESGEAADRLSLSGGKKRKGRGSREGSTAVSKNGSVNTTVTQSASTTQATHTNTATTTTTHSTSASAATNSTTATKKEKKKAVKRASSANDHPTLHHARSHSSHDNHTDHHTTTTQTLQVSSSSPNPAPASTATHTTATTSAHKDLKRDKGKERDTAGAAPCVSSSTIVGTTTTNTYPRNHTKSPTSTIIRSSATQYAPAPIPPPPPATIAMIPDEMLVRILWFLPHFPNLIACSTVCKRWYSLVTSAPLWQHIYLGEYEKIATDRLVVWIATMNPGLTTLSLKGCTQVTDVGLTAALGRCSNLRALYLEDLERQFTVGCMLMIGKLCPNLRTLVLPGILENPDVVIQPIISCCSKLKVFKSFSQVSQDTFKVMGLRCTNLRKLRFGTTTKSTVLSQAAIKNLGTLPHLKSLECGYFSLGEFDWGRVWPSFKSFRAFGWFDITPGALKAMLKNTPRLERLHLIHSGPANNDASLLMESFKFDYIGNYCPNLRNINLCDTPFCENDIQVLVKECKELRELRVGMKSNPGTNFEISDQWIYQVINFSTHVKVIKIYHAAIRAHTVSMLTRGCKNLRSLTLGRCSEIKEITSNLGPLTTLRSLSLRNTPTSDSALQMLMSAFSCLDTLTLIDTGVSNAMIGFIVGRYRLQSLKLQPRSRLTNEGKILYRGRSRGRFVKKQTLTPQENIFLTIFKTQQRVDAMIKKE
eukprot:TRINITY_DN8366_c0_g1_i1.p1 TRINITY_DN8366_c0_g1~~TRINITY_DN8366_c0_g1_i1.p1  ORF type:complete len:873 (-),score=107.28 TRINITY_DN8366_c0_g1_i1:17-2395(-)